MWIRWVSAGVFTLVAVSRYHGGRPRGQIWRAPLRSRYLFSIYFPRNLWNERAILFPLPQGGAALSTYASSAPATATARAAFQNHGHKRSSFLSHLWMLMPFSYLNNNSWRDTYENIFNSQRGLLFQMKLTKNTNVKRQRCTVSFTLDIFI